MADIHIHRDHQLGLAKARKVALQWAEQVESGFGMECLILEGETSDTVEFTRSGVKGELVVAANHFTLDAKLGFLLGVFSRKIEYEIEKNLDALLLKSATLEPKTAAPKTAAPKQAPPRTAAPKKVAQATAAPKKTAKTTAAKTPAAPKAAAKKPAVKKAVGKKM